MTTMSEGKVAGMDYRHPQQHCIRCGKGVRETTFRSALALKCDKCDENSAEERKEYHRVYHKARGRALKRLVDLHQREFSGLLAEERDAVELEEAGG